MLITQNIQLPKTSRKQKAHSSLLSDPANINTTNRMLKLEFDMRSLKEQFAYFGSRIDWLATLVETLLVAQPDFNNSSQACTSTINTEIAHPSSHPQGNNKLDKNYSLQQSDVSSMECTSPTTHHENSKEARSDSATSSKFSNRCSLAAPAIKEAKRRPTFAEIARRNTKTGSREEIERMKAAMQKCVGAKPAFTSTQAEVKHQCCRVYLRGIQHQPIQEVKSILYDLRFQLSKIWSIDFIGKNTLEFTLSASYAHSFVIHSKKFPFLTLLSKVDPTKPLDPLALPEVASKVKAAYIKRIQQSYILSNSKIYKDYLAALSLECNIPLNTDDNANCNKPETIQGADTVINPDEIVAKDPPNNAPSDHKQ
ncbi:hypothetical protein K7432_016859 [Basidiobolus ranarum]|uniref:Uncharacterized protein n=1 Tax=Basidiobolus ranarum TaxID=34480 RepID=A0ABR2WE53_9FUNG